MGASEFTRVGLGKNPKNAFRNARREAQVEFGTGGYSGSMAEKDSFVNISLPASFEGDAWDYAYELINKDDDRVHDKWGPAGCIEIQPYKKGKANIEVINNTKKGTKKWKTIYKISPMWPETFESQKEAEEDTKTKAIKRAKTLAKQYGEDYIINVEKKLISHNNQEAKIKYSNSEEKLGKYLFFGLASS